MTALEAVQRVHKTRGELTKLRNEGRLPGIVFGAGEENTMVHLSSREFQRWAKSGGSGLLTLNVQGQGKISVLLEAVQRDPVSRELLHVDFLRVKKDSVVRTNIALDYIGTAAGAKAGGLLQTQRTSIEIEALPADMPNAIQVDISKLEIGDVLRAGDISLPEGVALITDAEEVLVSCTGAQMQISDHGEEAAAAETSDAAESE